ncbi:MAG: Twitching mobility protein [candidate division BRC1 bacterium ADurb.BinA364]|nr:MAG: Twitching mobility protein [candidate division BRC1 bacterium ADurb.BinA364]
MAVAMNELLKSLMERGGSDLHILAGLPPAMRVHGELIKIEEHGALSPADVKAMIYAVLDDEQKQKFEHDKDSRYELDFALGLPGVGRFRFNVMKQRGTVGAVARALSSSIPAIEKLGLPESVSKFTSAKKGLALVTGPTGSGKSTTLAAIIDCINSTRADHIITIEDPIEYIHNSKKSYVMQREVGEAADTLSFKNALKYALRQDPDVILIGEMRDYETIGIAITSAETGHLVFGTLHTSSAAQTIGRIIDVFPADQEEQVKTQLAGNLVGVLAQILLPTADGKGRVAACEIMLANPAIRNNIRINNADGLYQSIMTGKQEGMQTMDSALAALVSSGRVAFETARPFIRDETTLRALSPFAAKSAESAGAPRTAYSPPAGEAAPPPRPAPVPPLAPDADEPKRRILGRAMIPPWERQQ